LFPASWLYFTLFLKIFKKNAELNFAGSTDLFDPKNQFLKLEAVRDNRFCLSGGRWL
jgi:hypothetical protein